MLIDNLMQAASHRRNYYETYLAEILPMALRFQVDNVAHYVYGNRQENEKKFSFNKQIPNIAPLAPVMWFEYNGLAAGKESSKNFGCLLHIDYDSVSGIKSKKYDTIDLPEDVRWVLKIETHGQDHDHGWTCDVTYLVSANADGQFVSLANYLNHQMHPSVPTPNTNLTDEKEHDFYVEGVIALTAICFAHCKGAEIIEHSPSRQVRRQAERKGQPVYSYRTIDIGPASRVLSGEGNISQNGLGKALHICRGHFAHYTAEKPLFGKYVGTVYKPMHLRGKAENGVVEKDYRVHAEAKS